jgi:hypothetical protein
MGKLFVERIVDVHDQGGPFKQSVVRRVPDEILQHFQEQLTLEGREAIDLSSIPGFGGLFAVVRRAPASATADRIRKAVANGGR